MTGTTRSDRYGFPLGPTSPPAPDGVNTAPPVKGGVPVRPDVLYHRGGWAYLCPVCAGSETGFTHEHHARTIGDEHVRHHLADLDGASSAPVPPAPVPHVDMGALRRRQAIACAVLARAVKEPK